ncbi:MAG: SH3 domain-containing protein [Chloroflexi bacterium]|nr:SH3 domain-containing protein [Chloroflexota bacterium]
MTSRLPWRAVVSALLAGVLTVALVPVLVWAQADQIPTGSTVRVANTDGDRLNLRAGPSTTDPIARALEPGTTLTVTGSARTVGGTRWLPVRTADGQSGWVSQQYVQVVSTPTPTPTRPPDATPTPPPTDPSAAPSSDGQMPLGRPLTVEAKVKFPEIQGREQEVTIWVLRDDQPVVGAAVTIETWDGDDATFDEHFRDVEPTDDEGRTQSIFDVRHDKGTVELRIKAVAPDGGEGQTTVTYFRR